jgi:AcrR family transcriptional regulator
MSEYSLIMSRKETYDNDTIIRAARKVFLEQGPGAPTSLIAQEAGVSEGLLFKRFKTKQQLFLTAMTLPETDMDTLLEERVGRGDVKDNLLRAAKEISLLLKEMFPSILMLWSNRQATSVDGIHRQSKPESIQFIRAVEKYLQGEIALGRVTNGDPLIAARVIVGGASNYVFWELMGWDKSIDVGMDEYMQGMINIVWEGLVSSDDLKGNGDND